MIRLIDPIYICNCFFSSDFVTFFIFHLFCWIILKLLKELKFLNVVDAEDCKKAQYFVLEYITNEQNKEITNHHIIDIEKYKKKLYIYPVSEGISSPLRKLYK